MARNTVRAWPLAAYAMPAFLSALVHGPAATIAPTLYASEFGLNLALVVRPCSSPEAATS